MLFSTMFCVSSKPCTSIISSLLSIEPRPGMSLQSQEQQAASLRKKVGIGAKSLDCDLGDVHTWPHSHYLMCPCNEVSGWVRLKYSCVDTKCAGAKSMI